MKEKIKVERNNKLEHGSPFCPFDGVKMLAHKIRMFVWIKRHSERKKNDDEFKKK